MRVMDEVKYSIHLAQEHDSRIVILGPLIFFSTDTGDAWMLDPEDAAALCLARDGQPQTVRIIETERDFAIEWTHQYRIDGAVFTIVDNSGRATSVQGYPTRRVLDAIERAGGSDL